MRSGNELRFRGARSDERSSLRALLVLLDEIAGALGARELGRIEELLTRPSATHIPSGVRDELHGIAAGSPESFRAPIEFLSYRHRMQQLEAGGEGLPTPQLELPLRRRRAQGDAA